MIQNHEQKHQFAMINQQIRWVLHHIGPSRFEDLLCPCDGWHLEAGQAIGPWQAHEAPSPAKRLIGSGCPAKMLCQEYVAKAHVVLEILGVNSRLMFQSMICMLIFNHRICK